LVAGLAGWGLCLDGSGVGQRWCDNVFRCHDSDCVGHDVVVIFLFVLVVRLREF
jgi:hypothetical protein